MNKNVNQVTSTSSPTTLLVQRDAKKANNTPTTGPTIEFWIKLPTTPINPELYPFDRLLKRRKKTIAVPSLNKASPSIRVLNLTLAPNSFNKATTATGSVALKTEPKVNA